jgi:hypothetical protein
MAGLPPEAAAPAGAPQAPAEGKDPSADIKEFVANISDGLAMITDVAKQMSPGAAEKIGQANQLFQAGIEELMSGGAVPQAVPQSGMAPPEVGGASGARPMSMGR